MAGADGRRGADMAGRERTALGRCSWAVPAENGTTGDAATDEALAARGDADSFIALYRCHLPAIYRYAYAHLGNRQDAEDLAALTFERAWAQRRHYRATGPFRGWLFGIAHRAVVDRRRRDRPVSAPVEALAEALPDPAAGPEAAAISAEPCASSRGSPTTRSRASSAGAPRRSRCSPIARSPPYERRFPDDRS